MKFKKCSNFNNIGGPLHISHPALERAARRRSKSEDYRPCIYRKTEEHLSTIKTEKKEVKSVKKKPKRDPNSTIFRACLW